jgi:cyclopropane fatty-acyl-phospholipid synthase-like methyltransferase
MKEESISERNGINFLSKTDHLIYSIGISTGGQAEMRMAQKNPKRRIVATTIDREGAEFAKKRISNEGFSDQIEVKIEDVTQPLSYLDGHFDSIYARLVLHYLPIDKLTLSLSEVYRILRKRGKIFIVVRSVECPEARTVEAKYDPSTRLTTYSSAGQEYSRYFHSRESIAKHLSSAGFATRHIDAYQEQLCVDFQRTKPSGQIDHLIEVIAEK